jgi:hypothetical protein
MPVAVGIAVLRYRLYEIDRIINRTFVYGTLTAILALVYFGGVAATQAVIGRLPARTICPSWPLSLPPCSSRHSSAS